MIDRQQILDDFPVLTRMINDHPLAYFDSAATTLKPRQVVAAITEHYLMGTSNIHRGVHQLSQEATELYEGVRDKVKAFINAQDRSEIVFTRGTTHSINMIARSLAQNWNSGDEVIITQMEHHANIVPWQMLREQMGLVIRIIPMDQKGDLILDDIESFFNERTRLLSVTAISNALGTVNPVQKMIEIAHNHSVLVLLDCAQWISHMKTDVQELDCDFMVFSAHKMFGPTGVGGFYGKRALLEKMEPVEGGGDMILSVTFEKTIYNELPYKFEAGTPHIAGVIGLGAAIDYIDSIGIKSIQQYEAMLLQEATARLKKVDGVQIIGEADEKASVISFLIDGVHPHDIGTMMDYYGIAIRTGHHCAQPVMDHFKIPATARISLSIYNTLEEIDRLVVAIKEIQELFA